MVFQSYALFPHMTVAENVAFGLEMQKVGRAEREKRVLETLSLVQLDHLADRLPRQLSGGQQQRVALARSLRSEEHTSELQSLMRISYAVFCLKQKTNIKPHN